MTSARREPRRGVAMLATGVVCAIGGAFLWLLAPPARADAPLSSFRVASGARGWRFFDEDATNGNQEGEVPEASANLANGPIGYALASVVWPGPLASNAGSLILVLQPTAPPQATVTAPPTRTLPPTLSSTGTTASTA